MSAVSIPTPITRAISRTIACVFSWGACSNRCARASSTSLIWSMTKRNRAMSRRSSRSVFGGRGTPSGVPSMARRSGALRNVGLKFRIPKRGWLRGEPDHCHMAAIPTLAEEDAKRPNREREGLVRERTRIVNRMKSCLARFGIRNFKPTLRKAPERLATLATPEAVPLPPNTLLELRRDMARLRFVMDQIKEVEEARAQRLEQAPQERTHAMVRLIARVIGVGIETADMLVHEILSRQLRDRRAVARYAGLTGAPDESGNKRREKGLAKAGNARVRRGMIQLAWRFLVFQKDSALARWYRTRTESAGKKRKTMIVALARKLLIALWRLVTIGEVPAGVVLRAA